MINTETINKWIFYLMALFALTTGVVPSVANDVLAITVLLGIISWKMQKPLWCLPKPYARALFIFFSVMLIMVFLSPDVLKSAKEFWRFTNRLLAGALVLFFIKERTQLLKIFFAFLVSMSINNIYSIYEGIRLLMTGSLDIRSFGFENGPIMLSGQLLICVPLLFILLMEGQSKKWRIFIVSAFAISLFAVLLNGTRVAWIILVMILPGIAGVYLNNWRKLFCFLVLISFFCGLIVYTTPFLRQRVLTFTDNSQVSNRGHYLIMRDSLQLIKDQPILGVGLGRYQQVFNDKYRSAEHIALESGLTPHAHDNTLTVLAETGIFGCLAFWFMYGSFLYYSFKRWLDCRQTADLMFFIITLASVLQGLTDYSFGFNQVIKIYFCFLAMYLNYQYREMIKPVSNEAEAC